MRKSSVDEIRARFDADVERFSSLETGQAAAVDSPLCMDLLTEAAAKCTPSPKEVLDLGCGAGNYTLRLLSKLSTHPERIRLVDLSEPMVDRAVARLREAGYAGEIIECVGDLREVSFGNPDIVLAAAVLHHLRSPEEWHRVFTRLREAIPVGGGLWIYDMVDAESPVVRDLMKARYGDYLTALRDESYRDHVFAYIDQEDTPAPLTFQLELLRKAGFSKVDVLHVNSGFAAFGALV